MPLLLSAQSLSIALEPSDYNGYNISCFGLKDGAIDATISGGTLPYTITWSNGASTEDLVGLASGYYKVEVMDADSVVASAQITLTEPMSMKVAAEPFRYPSGFNISCYECFNGSIDVTVYYGVPPYTYDWGDEVYTQDRAGLGSMKYGVKVTDANGCNAASETVYLTQPERKDWTMEGNANTDASQHFFGTTDAQDVVFKSNGTEAIRLLPSGQMRVSSLAGEAAPGLVMFDSDGTLKRFVEGDIPEVPIGCPDNARYPWLRCGNTVAFEEYLGTNNARPLVIKTNAEFRMIVTSLGRVGIGTQSPVDALDIWHTDERGGLRLINGSQGNAHSEIRFFDGPTLRWAFGSDLQANGGQDFFLWDEQATAVRLLVNSQGKVGIGTTPPSNGSLYKLYVGDGIATRDVKVTAGNWPDYVFADDYQLMPLSELRNFLSRNRHLPGVPSAAEVERNEGVELGDMQARLLKVAEEQALYILRLEERISALEATLAKNKQ